MILSENTNEMNTTASQETQQSTSQQNVNSNNNSKSNSYNRTIIPNTPFAIAETPDGYFMQVGVHKITEIFKTEEELKKDIKKLLSLDWRLLSGVIGALTEYTYYTIKIEEDKQNQKQNN